MKEQVIIDILSKGILAPSADNLQPWLFKIHNNRVDLFLDQHRIQNFCDEGLLVPYLSVGAILENMRVQAAEFGYQPSPAYLPTPADPLHVVSIQFNETIQRRHPHAEALEKRVTNRKFYDPSRNISPALYAQLERLVDQEHEFKLLWILNQGASYKKLTCLIAEADELRFEIERLHREFITTLRFDSRSTEQTRDGIDLRTLETGPGGVPLFKTIRSWLRLKSLNAIGMSKLFNLYAQLQMRSAQATGLLIAKSNKPLDYLRGGEVMERLWHEITLKGLALQPMEGLPIFIINLNLTGGKNLAPKQKKKLEELKSEFYSLFGINDRNGLILLFRMGYAPPPSAHSLRRPIESFLI
ncbi:MAG: hypothetical protein HYS55_03850 [Candidatus Omnitrophica bacterium]|nr:hypothetical protein [Candidatus Omnitrophota bacterium]